jgi:hypothetical protein
MRDRTLVLKSIGGLWLIAGILGALWGATSLLSRLLGVPTPSFLGGASNALLILPWAQLAIIASAGFLLIAGWGLLARQRWVQTVMVPAHLLFMVYSVVLLIASLVTQRLSPSRSAGMPALWVISILVNGGMALFMSGAGATESLSWLPLRTTPLIPMRCEFCGTPLDVRTNRCPQCESIPEVISQSVRRLPPQGLLISLADDTRFEIKPERAAMVGRGSAQNAINLSNPTVSRHHAQISYKQEHYVLTALQDLNGTYVNETLVRERALENGDEIRFGRARFQFRLMELDGRARD